MKIGKKGRIFIAIRLLFQNLTLSLQANNQYDDFSKY